jgi:hypothetical protein
VGGFPGAPETNQMDFLRPVKINEFLVATSIASGLRACIT